MSKRIVDSPGSKVGDQTRNKKGTRKLVCGVWLVANGLLSCRYQGQSHSASFKPGPYFARLAPACAGEPHADRA